MDIFVTIPNNKEIRKWHNKPLIPYRNIICDFVMFTIDIISDIKKRGFWMAQFWPWGCFGYQIIYFSTMRTKNDRGLTRVGGNIFDSACWNWVIHHVLRIAQTQFMALLTPQDSTRLFIIPGKMIQHGYQEILIELKRTGKLQETQNIYVRSSRVLIECWK